MDKRDLFTVSGIAQRSGFAASAIRFYENQGRGLIHGRTRQRSGGQRRFEQQMLRRLAFIRAARNVGLNLDEVAEGEEETSNNGCILTRADWARLSKDLARTPRSPDRGAGGTS